MATATLHVPQDMSNPLSIAGGVISYSPTEITVVDGNFTATYFGTFTYDMGELIGGSDIVLEMFQSGDLQKKLDAALSSAS